MSGPLTKIVGRLQVSPESLDDQQISPTAEIVESKIAFSVLGHDHDGIVSKAIDYNNLVNKPDQAETSDLAFYLSIM